MSIGSNVPSDVATEDHSSAPMSVHAQTSPPQSLQRTAGKSRANQREAKNMTERGHAPKPIDAKPTGATLMQRGKRVQQQRRMYSAQEVEPGTRAPGSGRRPEGVAFVQYRRKITA